MRKFLIALLFAPTVCAAADSEFRLSIHEHRFEPAELRVPAGKRVRLTIVNQDPEAEEFESYELHREKLIPGNSSGTVYIGPLEPGRYPFFGDFHPKTTTGVVIAE
ncbi:MAG: cupredoxin domain-containing protein [Burkholderiales bacterium]